VRFHDVHFYIASDPDAWVHELDLHAVEVGGSGPRQAGDEAEGKGKLRYFW